jgi:predicted O-methyltransferase YrrM
MAACTVSLLRATSRKPCTRDVSYGCNDTATMWVASGCRGLFHCSGTNLTCGYAGLILRPPRYVYQCPCAPYWHGGLFRRDTGTPTHLMPHGLSVPPRLRHTRHGKPRFVPDGENETLTATFTMWNLLDAMMSEAGGNSYQAGYVREVQLRRMVQLAQHGMMIRHHDAAVGGARTTARPTEVVTYCEVGFNGGHSAVAMLLANPQLVVHSFDLLMWKYSRPILALLTAQFGGRLNLHVGDSTRTVPAWARANRGACDLILVDGDHNFEGARKDMLNLREAAHPHAVCIADDIQSSPGDALASVVDQGLVRVDESYGPFDAPSAYNPCMRGPKGRGPICLPWGFAVYRYANVAATPSSSSLTSSRLSLMNHSLAGTAGTGTGTGTGASASASASGTTKAKRRESHSQASFPLGLGGGASHLRRGALLEVSKSQHRKAPPGVRVTGAD